MLPSPQNRARGVFPRRSKKQRARTQFSSELLESRDLLAGDLIISGVLDGPLPGGTPKAIEIYANANVADLSAYGLGSANNGGGTDGPEVILSGSAIAGQFLYVASETTEFLNFFGFAPDFTDSAANINGDDAVELFYDANGDGLTNPIGSDDVVSDVFGDINTDGTGQVWEYLDSWAYRNAGTGPDGATFSVSNWMIPGIDVLDNEAQNSSATTPFPIGTYTNTAGAEIDVLNGGTSISSGDATPSTNDGTDFGALTAGSSAISVTFTIANTGSSALSLSGSPAVTISGSTDFAISTQPALTNIAVGGSTTFEVEFDPQTVGTQTATVRIANSDADENPYTFDVQGAVATGTSPEIGLLGNGIAIADGDATPDSADDTDFGTANTSGGSVTKTFTIENSGTAALIVEGITISGANAADFTLGTAPTTVAAGNSATFDITFDPSASGTRTATVTINSSDSDEAVYDFAIQGGGLSVATNIVINEVDADTVDENNEFVELYDGGVGNTPLDGLVIVFFNGGDNLSDGNAIDLDDFTTDASGFFVIGDGDTLGVDLVPAGFDTVGDTSPASDLQNGEDAVALYADDAVNFPNDTAATTANLLDAVVYKTGTDPATTLQTDLGVSGVIDEDLNANKDTESISRSPDFAGPFIVVPPTPGRPNGTATPEIDVLGNGISIADGDTTPDIADDTDFGSFIAGAAAVTRTFSISNTGSSLLTLGTISLSGANEFTTSQPSAATVTPGGTETFAVTFTPVATGTRTATITIPSDDADENPYTFELASTVITSAAPEIEVLGNAVTIFDGDTTPDALDNTDFGNVIASGGSITRTYDILNTGTATLNVANITISGTNATDFALSPLPTPTAIASGGVATFDVTFSPTANGIRTATVNVASDDADENPYAFAIHGTGATIANGVVINEVDADTADENNEFIELYDGGIGNTALDGLVVVLLNGNGPSSYGAIDLDGFSTDANGFFVIGDADAPNVDLVPSNFDVAGAASPGSDLQNGEDGVALYVGNAADFPNGTLATTVNLVDAVVYETGADPNTTLPAALGGVAVVDEDANSNKELESASRSPDGSGAFVTVAPTPGLPNATVVLEPEIDVSGNSVSIADGDNTPDVTDDTDFGSIILGSAPVVRTFTITNSGAQPLLLGTMSISGTVDFTLTPPSTNSVPVGGTTTFTVTFAPPASGTGSARIEIPSNDADESPYTFHVTGTATLDPEIDVTGTTSFGAIDVASGPATQTFTIENQGSTPLVIFDITIGGTDAADFSFGSLPSTIAPGTNATFDVNFDPTNNGTKTATLNIISNDADESPFPLNLEGEGVTIARNVVINEVDADTADENQEFIELFDGGVGNTSLDGLVIVLFNGNGSVSYSAIDLDGLSTDSDGFFVIGDADTPNVGLVPNGFDAAGGTGSDLQNGEDGVALYIGSGSDFPNGTLATTANLLDAMVYETGADTDTTLAADLGSVPVIDEDANGDKDIETASRFPDGTGIYSAAMATPGEPNTVTLAPEIVVRGRGRAIENGDTTPSFDDNTNFDSVDVTSGLFTRTFIIENPGNTTLEIDSISVDGTNAGDFNLRVAPATAPAGGSAHFIVDFNPSATGVRSAIISIENSDVDNDPYTFAIQGTATGNDIGSDPGSGVGPGGGGTVANVVINEVDADTSDENNEFIELYDGGVGNTPLDGVVLVLFNGNGAASYAAIDLDGFSTNSNGFFVIGDADTPNVDLVPEGFDMAGASGGSDLQNGEDGVALYEGNASDFPNGTPATKADLLDAVVYETGDDTDSSLPTALGLGAVIDENSNGIKDTESVSRFPDGTGIFASATPTPGEENAGSNGGGGGTSAGEIDVLGNGVSIPDGDATPSFSDDTDFDEEDVASGSSTRTYTIANSGSGPLLISSIIVGGTNPSDFSIGSVPTSIAPGDSEIFTVTFDPSAPGTRTATVTISNDDANENPYTFDVQGEGSGTADDGGGGEIATGVVINEVDSDTSDENHEFIELYDGGIGNTSLSGLVVVLFNGNGSTSYNAIDLDGFSTDSAGFFVIGDADTPNVDLVPVGFDMAKASSGGSDIQNGEDAVALYRGNASDFPNGAAATTTNLLNAVVHETGADTDSSLPTDLGVSSVIDENSNRSKDTESVSRFADGAVAFAAAAATPGEHNAAGNGIGGTPTPEIDVLGNGVSIAAGDTTPSFSDDTDFDEEEVASGTSTATYAIANSGDATLSISSITVDGSHPSDFSLGSVPTSVAPGETDRFSVTFDPTAPGTRTATITINSNANEGTYTFTIQGTGSAISGGGGGPVTQNVVINEVDSDTSDENNEFIELYDGGVGNTPLGGLVVVLFNGNGSTSYNAIDLEGFTTDSAGFFVIGDADTPNVSLVPDGFDVAGAGSGGSDIQNGEDGVALYEGSAADFPNGTVATAAGLLDAIVYETGADTDSTLVDDLGTSAVIDEGSNGNKDIESLSRVPNGTAAFVASTPTPGRSNGGESGGHDSGGDDGTGRECTPGNGDIDGDGVVDFADYLRLSGDFGMTGANLASDVNCNGAADFPDYLILSGNFSQTNDVEATSLPNTDAVDKVMSDFEESATGGRRPRG